jgi:hypothetical protein
MNTTAMRNCIRTTWLSILVLVMLGLSGCTGNVGVGVSVGVPIGSHGYMSVGSSRWF